MPVLTQPLGWSAVLPPQATSAEFSAFLGLESGDLDPAAKRLLRQFRSTIASTNAIWLARFSLDLPPHPRSAAHAETSSAIAPLTAIGLLAENRTTAKSADAVLAYLAGEEERDVANASAPATLCGLPARAIARVRRYVSRPEDQHDAAEVPLAAGEGSLRAMNLEMPEDIELFDGELKWSEFEVLYATLEDGLTRWARFVSVQVSRRTDLEALFDLTARVVDVHPAEGEADR